MKLLNFMIPSFHVFNVGNWCTEKYTSFKKDWHQITTAMMLKMITIRLCCCQIYWTKFGQPLWPWSWTNLAWQCTLYWIGDWHWRLLAQWLGLTQLWSQRGRVHRLLRQCSYKCGWYDQIAMRIDDFYRSSAYWRAILIYYCCCWRIAAARRCCFISYILVILAV